jgi:predicted aspartyl protease
MRTHILAAILSLALLPGLANAEERCPLKAAASVQLSIGEGGLPTIPVKINSRDEILIVDTGAPVSLISAGIVVELKLARKPYPRGVFVMANGTSPQEVATIDELALGELTGHDLSFFIIPSIQVPSTLAGSFGVDFLQGWDVDFDFGRKKFNLVAPDSCQGRPVYWTKDKYVRLPVHVTDDKHLRVHVKLDGKELNAVLDSGSTSSAMNLAVAEKLFNLHESVLPMPHTAFNGVIQEARLTGKMYDYTFKSLELDGMTIPSPTILLASNLDLGDEQLIIGMSELKKLHLYISYKDEIAYITPAGAN